MPQISKTTPRKEATFNGIRLACPLPYAEGHSLTANEAVTLNQTYVENIRNNCHNAIGEMVDAAGSLESVDPKAAQKLIDDYCAKYEFHERKGGGFRSADPVESAAMELARGKVRDAIVKKGIKLKDVPAAKVTELARDAIAKNPAFLERAKSIVAARQKAADELTVEVPV